jgi:hypothetical protein
VRGCSYSCSFSDHEGCTAARDELAALLLEAEGEEA